MRTRTKYLGMILVVFCLVYGWPTLALPWCWIRHTGTTGAGCPTGGRQQDCCSGNLRLWQYATMQYRISNSTDSSLLSDIRSGADRWNNISMSTFSFTEGSRTNAWAYAYDGINLINIDASFCDPTHYQYACGMGILGFSGTWTTSIPFYRAIESDVILNGEEYTWGDGTGGTYNTTAVIAHELGHDAGLSHAGDECRDAGSAGCGPEFPSATMYWNYSGGQPTDKASLELDDVAALIYGYPLSTLRVRVLTAAGAPVSGATVELIGTASPVNGSTIGQGGSVYGDIAASLVGDKVSSNTYFNSTPFNTTNTSGYTNYIYPVAQSFSVRAAKGSETVTQAITASAGVSTVTVQFESNCPDCPSNGIIKNVTYPAGSVCVCTNLTSITVGPGVTVQDGADVTFIAPRVKFLPGFRASSGAEVSVRQ